MIFINFLILMIIIILDIKYMLIKIKKKKQKIIVFSNIVKVYTKRMIQK